MRLENRRRTATRSPCFRSPATTSIAMKTSRFLLAGIAVCIVSVSQPLSLAASAPPAGTAGRYVMPANAAIYCDLRPDGTFSFALPGQTITGTYVVKGTEVTLSTTSRPVQVMLLADGFLIDPDGTKWPKAGAGGAPPAAAPIPAGLTGRYAIPGDEGFIDLRPDGTFSISQGNRSSPGTYTVIGTVVNLTVPGAAAPQLHFANGVLTIGNGVKMPRVGEAAPPPVPGTVAGPALASSEQMHATLSINHVKQLCIAAKLWAGAHKGSFPDTLEQLLTKEYIGTDPTVVHCPLLQDDTQVGYLYLGKGLKDSVAGETILFMSKWTGADGKRVIGRADIAAMLAVPKPGDIPPAAAAMIQSSKPVSGSVAPVPGSGTPNPASATPAATPVAAANLAKITLSLNNNGKGRYGAIFPEAQMPADQTNYFWVTDRPDNTFNVTPLQRNTWFVALVPGIYKVRIEYREGKSRTQVSNLVEVTVPNTGK